MQCLHLCMGMSGIWRLLKQNNVHCYDTAYEELANLLLLFSDFQLQINCFFFRLREVINNVSLSQNFFQHKQVKIGISYVEVFFSLINQE